MECSYVRHKNRPFEKETAGHGLNMPISPASTTTHPPACSNHYRIIPGIKPPQRVSRIFRGADPCGVFSRHTRSWGGGGSEDMHWGTWKLYAQSSAGYGRQGQPWQRPLSSEHHDVCVVLPCCLFKGHKRPDQLVVFIHFVLMNNEV